jgi:hypothetical protein
MREGEFKTDRGDLSVQGGISHREPPLRFLGPFARTAGKAEPPTLGQQSEFPDRDRREPGLTGGRVDRTNQGLRESLGPREVPEPHMRIKKERRRAPSGSTRPAHPSASQSSSPSGSRMSASSSAVPRIAPKAPLTSGGGGGGMTWAMGTPRFVTSRGRPVLRTRSKAAKQVALNREMGTVSTDRTYYDRCPWSNIDPRALRHRTRHH